MDTGISAEGKLYIVSAPSGAGKTSMLKQLIKRKPELKVSVSHTTRSSRPGEKHGVNYYFVSIDEFKQAIEDKAFFEHAEVFGNYYGTSKETVQQQLDEGDDVILEIDWQGARKVREQFSEVISIFILPPSRNDLESRLQDRQQDSDQVIQARMQEASEEMEHYHEYDYIIINDDFEQAINELEAIFDSENLRLEMQQQKHKSLLDELLGNGWDNGSEPI
ncbi:MAG: guanylate kinase [Thiotrichaceae bacterium]